MPNWSEEIFVVGRVKNTVPWIYIINDLNGQYMLNGKVKIIHLIVGLIKKILYKK